jgi:membrane protein
VSPDRERRRSRTESAHQQFDAARTRYERSWVGDVIAQLKTLHFLDWTLIFGAELLWSALPFMILLSSLANERIDDDLSRHIGLNGQGAHIVHTLFRNRPTHAAEPIITGLLFAFAGIIAVVGSLQVIYERLFEQDHRGWRDLPRFIAWVFALLGLLILEGAIDKPERSALGPIVQAVLGFVVVAAFFAWTMHFLLAGRVPWRLVIEPALVTALLWTGLALFSSLYFSSVVIDDSRLYGTIGVVFTLLTWFILIGSVIMLGATFGAVWQRRAQAPVEAGTMSPPSAQTRIQPPK